MRGEKACSCGCIIASATAQCPRHTEILICSLSPIFPLYPYPIRAGGDSNMKFPTALAAVVAAMLLCRTIAPTATPADMLPSQISDAEFWRFVTGFSEPNGPYPYENYVGNEVMLQRVIPAARKETKPGGVYIGVGP